MASIVVTNTVHVEHNFLYRLRVLGKVCLYFGVAVTVLYFQIAKRPKEADTYYTIDPNDTTHGGVNYKCGCSLPSSLQKKGTDPDVNVHSLNICYDRSNLETVTVLMYSEFAALLEPQLEPEITELAPYNITYSTVEGGYSVDQQAHDLSGYINDWADDEPPTDLAKLYLNGFRSAKILPSAEYLQGPEFMSFPKSYVRLAFEFNCTDCNKCPLEEVNGLFQKAVNGSNKDNGWANCFPWGSEDRCRTENYYQAKCVLYPTEVLPANFAIKRFFEMFVALPEIRFGDSDPTGNWTRLEPSSLYLNISKVRNNTNPTQFGFVEVVQGSALWSSLLTKFPSLGSCADMHEIKVCNGTSVCNVYSNANSYDLKCLDMNDTAQCQDLMGLDIDGVSRSSFDNAKSVKRPDLSWLDLECPKFSCKKAPPYLLHWNTSEQLKTDSLNKFLSSTILNENWAQLSGVCTNTYENVLRFPRTKASAEAERNHSNTIFLESKCANPTDSSSYCWLTGNYHSLSDTSADGWKKLEDKNLFPDPDRLFVCYRLDDQNFGLWIIATVGILSGWLGAVDQLLRSEKRITVLIHKFRDRRHARRLARIQRRLLQQDDPDEFVTSR